MWWTSQVSYTYWSQTRQTYLCVFMSGSKHIELSLLKSTYYLRQLIAIRLINGIKSAKLNWCSIINVNNCCNVIVENTSNETTSIRQQPRKPLNFESMFYLCFVKYVLCQLWEKFLKIYLHNTLCMYVWMYNFSSEKHESYHFRNNKYHANDAQCYHIPPKSSSLDKNHANI